MPRNVAARLMKLETTYGARQQQRMLREIADELGIAVADLEAAIADGQRNADALGITPHEYILRSFASWCDQTGTVADLDPASLVRMEEAWPDFTAEVEAVLADPARRL